MLSKIYLFIWKKIVVLSYKKVNLKIFNLLGLLLVLLIGAVDYLVG